MTEDALILLCLKAVLIAAETAIVIFVAAYTRWAPWWRDEIGRTIVTKDILLAAALALTIISLFFQFNRATSHAAAWLDIAIFGAVTPVMTWRTLVFRRIHRAGGAPSASLPLAVAGHRLRSLAARARGLLRRLPRRG